MTFALLAHLLLRNFQPSSHFWEKLYQLYYHVKNINIVKLIVFDFLFFFFFFFPAFVACSIQRPAVDRESR